MKFVYACGLLAASGLMTWSVPLEYLPVSWHSTYFGWFGEPSYIAAPENREISVAALELDDVCPPELDAWRAAMVVDGVQIDAVADCTPDNPWDVAVAVKGVNHVSPDTLQRSLFAADTLHKRDDRDGDGDPDLIEIRLEVMELNGHSRDGRYVIPQFEIAPAITPGFWVFAPKTRGMTTINFESLLANRIIRMPAPSIRIEQGDEVRIILENSHYLPHTIHFHGVDHPFVTPEGGGNDGVPVFSEHPIMPGEAREYWLQPRHPGTAFYHCHVQPQSHILLGLQGLLVVEENRPNNWVQTFNIGAGRVRAPSVASRENFAGEYDLHYLEVDSRLNNRIQQHNDPRLVAKAVHRDYNVTERQANYYLLNGRSFPYTLKESLIVVRPNEKYRLRVLNGGGEGLALHLHGHKPILTHRDGVALALDRRVQRDVFWIASAQRIDLTLNTENNGLNANGEGAWLAHDHREQAVTTNGIGPGGDVSLVVYEEYLGPRGLPKSIAGLQDLASFFSPAYYRGEVPVFTGMGNHQLGDPQVGGVTPHKTWLFWLGLGLSLVFIALLIHRVGWRDE